MRLFVDTNLLVGELLTTACRNRLGDQRIEIDAELSEVRNW
jgi:hypothetical protein